MSKTILITGSTDGIGLETAKILLSAGHNVLLHGRNPEKLEQVKEDLSSQTGVMQVEGYLADLSNMEDIKELAKAVIQNHPKLDVLINNAGILKTSDPVSKDGLDIRFAVNTIAPYLLTQELFPSFTSSARVINLSSAAQSPVDIKALLAYTNLPAMEAYSQSKLAITMWSRHMALSQKYNDIIVIAVNPGSLLGSKMVKEGFGIAGGDIRIGANILCQLALEDEFKHASGQYFDNDKGQFGSPHPDALDTKKSNEVVTTIESILTQLNL